VSVSALREGGLLEKVASPGNRPRDEGSAPRDRKDHMSIKHYEQEQMEKLTGQYRHYCPEFDGMAIDETCPEFEYCLCYER
jgi:hypothetical protein